MATTRRSFLAGVAAAAGVSGGCAARGETDGGGGPVSLLAAGSLDDALENGLRPGLDVPLRVEPHGSAAAARMVAEGQKSPDVVSLADVSLFDSPLDPAWYAEFATNALVVAYNPDTPGGRRVGAAGADGWFRPMLAGEARVGRTDPDADPLGYRTLFALELATDHYGTDRDLREALPTRGQTYPETQLVGQFETGAIDAAFTYRNMAVERGYEFVDLPAAIDLSDPARADAYASATYALPGGETVRGGVISYGSTVRPGRVRDAVVDAFEAQCDAEYLREFGFGVPEDYPRYTGDVPDALAG